jgi:hypothetical protein
METPQPPQVSVSGRIFIEGQLPTSGASPENPPPPPSPPWWRFWRDTPEALTAKATLVLALGTVALAIFSLVTLLVTHADTRRLIKEARIASKQQHDDTFTAIGKAEIANEISQKSLSIVQRPFMFVAETPMVSLLHDNIVRWNFPIYWENSGATATKNLYIEIYCPYGDHELTDPTTQKGTDVFIVRMIFGPKQRKIAGGCYFEASHMAAMQAGAAFGYILAKSIYQDQFDENSIHLTENCEQVVATSAD